MLVASCHFTWSFLTHHSAELLDVMVGFEADGGLTVGGEKVRL